MPSARELADRIERHDRDAHTAKRFRELVLADLRTALPCQGHVFALTDPVTKVATAPLADVPGLEWPRLPELIRARYLTPRSRWDGLLGSGARSLLELSGGDPEQAELWRLQRDLGVLDSATVAFGDRYGCWGFLELLRYTGKPFTAAELATLTSIAGSITTGLRRALGRTFTGADARLPPVGPAVLILDPGLRVRAQTAAAATALLRLNPPDEPMAPIPASAYNAGAALLAVERDLAIGLPWSRIHLGGNRWVTVKADRLGTDIAVSIEPSSPAERLDLFARAHALSARESEVLALLAAGLDSRQLAAELVLSEHTVNDHVKSILAKCAARTRNTLLSRVLGIG
ncbi:helix-turn-helix transcriptional regulator [Nocardia inohanensis]|uniref:helix-turn-helix transcriptional regulator n=1 Tax=Nocardia inohanensis TaxID=209246 RepID=UPI0008376748|nr:helix-turn-helix transcriptional regulator [Nocardia inohanensis]